MPPLGVARALFAAAVLPSSDVVCVFGGLRTTDGCMSGEALDAVECFDPTLGEWRTAPPLPHALIAPTATALNATTMLVVGGRTTASPQASSQSRLCWLFNPASGLYAPAPELPHTLSSAVAQSADGDVFVSFGWRDDNFCHRNLLVLRGADGYTGDWFVFPRAKYSHCDHGMAAHRNGSGLRLLFFAGSADNAPALNSMNEWHVHNVSAQNASTGWRPMPGLAFARDMLLHASDPLSGRVFAMGGRDPEMVYLRSIEMWSDGAWSIASASLPEALIAGQAVVLDAGRRLCVLGGVTAAAPVSSAAFWCRADLLAAGQS